MKTVKKSATIVFMQTALLFFSFITSALMAQPLPISTTHQIDSLFSAWNTPNSPGCAIGIVRNDSLIYTRGYGMANLETSTPITPETIFCVASVSKQFTGYGIVLLTEAGKLRLDDEVRTYLPWMPNFKQKITIRHLLNHTSGLRDCGNAALLGGIGFDGLITQQLALDYIKNAIALNFPPGEKYAYTNTNYILLAEIIRKVSGQSVNDFASKAIFKPLGMLHSLYLEQPDLIIKSRAVSYTKNSYSNYVNTFDNVYTVGDGGVFSNVQDLAKWVANFYRPKAGDKPVIAQLVEPGKLSNGHKLTYAKGIYTNYYKGFIQYTHGGSVASFRTNIAVYPELTMGFIVLANDATIDPAAKSNELVDIFLRNRPAPHTMPASLVTPLVAAATRTPAKTRVICGNYLADDGVQMSFTCQNEHLFLESAGHRLPLIEVAKDTFMMAGNAEYKFVFAVNKTDTIMHMLSNDSDRQLTKYVVEGAVLSNELQTYAGIYYSPELDLRYRLLVKDNRLFLHNLRSGDLSLKVLNRNDMLLESYGARLSFLLNRQNRPSGFNLSNGGLVNVQFNKLN